MKIYDWRYQGGRCCSCLLRKPLSASSLLRLLCFCFSSKAFVERRWHLGDSAIRASIEKGYPLKALSDYRSLSSSGNRHFKIGRQTLRLVLQACRVSGELTSARETHGRITKTGLSSCDSLFPFLFHLYLDYDCLREARSLFEEMSRRLPDPLHGNLLLAAYLRNGRTDDASQLFDKMQTRDLISWNTMAAVWARSSQPRRAMALFEKMLLSSGIEPDGFTFSVILSACAQTGALALGQRIHRLIQTQPVNMNPILSSALIDMYSKCGKLDLAWGVFDSAERSNTSVWNSMISGLAIHGQGKEALHLFDRMLESGSATLDHITFLGILTACSHSSLVEEGLHHFFAMKLIHSIDPRMEHYGSVIDLLCRAGRIDEAHLAMEALPLPPDAAMWRALLSGCRKHRRPDIAMAVPPPLLSPERCSGNYLLLSSLYSAAGRWSSAEAVWRRMKEDRLRKKVGLSWADLGGIVEQFQAGERWRLSRSTSEAEGMQRVLHGLTRAAREMGFEAAADVVGVDLLEEEKEANLMYHSEKLAVAYAVVKTAPGTEIRVAKNLRACIDCHSWLKAASKFLGRVIVVRDRTRFHHFVQGSCSCKDFW